MSISSSAMRASVSGHGRQLLKLLQRMGEGGVPRLTERSQPEVRKGHDEALTPWRIGLSRQKPVRARRLRRCLPHRHDEDIVFVSTAWETTPKTAMH